MSFPRSRYVRKWIPGRRVRNVEDFENLRSEGRLFIPTRGPWAGRPVSGEWLRARPYFIFLPAIESGQILVAVPNPKKSHFQEPEKSLRILRHILFELSYPGDQGVAGEDEPWSGDRHASTEELLAEAWGRIKKLCPLPSDFPKEDYVEYFDLIKESQP